MNANQHFLIAQQRVADHQRAAERSRLASEARASRRDRHDAERIANVRARLFRLAARLASPS